VEKAQQKKKLDRKCWWWKRTPVVSL